MSYIGDMILGQTFDTKFCTVQSTGAPTTLAGTPVVSNYVGNSTTQITSGITLTADFDSVTGLNNVRVVATAANGYTQMSDNQLVITTGTVNSVSAIGYVVAEYSIQNRYYAGMLGRGALTAATSTTADLPAFASYGDDLVNGGTIVAVGGTGAGQARLISDFADSNNRATTDAWTTTPSTDTIVEVFATPPSSTSVYPSVSVKQWNGTNVATPTTAGVPEVDLTHVNGAPISQGGDAPSQPYGLS